MNYRKLKDVDLSARGPRIYIKMEMFSSAALMSSALQHILCQDTGIPQNTATVRGGPIKLTFVLRVKRNSECDAQFCMISLISKVI